MSISMVFRRKEEKVQSSSLPLFSFQSSSIKKALILSQIFSFIIKAPNFYILDNDFVLFKEPRKKIGKKVSRIYNM